MDRILNQVRRIYTDDGKHDVDFSEYETRLAEAKFRLFQNTQSLIRAAQNLNRAAMAAGFDPDSTPH